MTSRSEVTPLHIHTPLLESRSLSTMSGKTVLLKMEASQPPGSFKIRGIGLACEEYARRGATRFISSSGGNAGIAVAYAGRHLQIPVTVVVPETTSEHAKALIRLESGKVIVHGASWQEANALAQSMIDEQTAFIHPFDDPLLWRGHAGMIDEVTRAGVRPDAVVLSVGGGGLLCGVVEGLRRNGMDNVPVVAVETAGADSFAQSLAAGHRIALDRITSIATSLGARQVCEQAFRWASVHPVKSAVVSDEASVFACKRFLDEHRILVEPACGASLALLYERSPTLESFGTLLVIVCGGATTTTDQLQAWSTQFLQGRFSGRSESR
ncbi:MAG: pyridoxal-phosphate dependent enzyme [Steroidobacteraceae bacterium]|jgi:L-serine/L-threonine ammonia-lyase